MYAGNKEGSVDAHLQIQKMHSHGQFWSYGTLPDVCPSACCPPHRCGATRQTESCHAGIPPPTATARHVTGAIQWQKIQRHLKNSGNRKTREAHSDLIELAKVQRAIAVDRWADIFTVVTIFDQLQLPHAAHVGKPRLYLCHVQNLKRTCT